MSNNSSANNPSRRLAEAGGEGGLRLIYAAAHAGYDPGSIPLGGAAAICERLVAKWSGRVDVNLTLIGPGEGRHYQGIRYVKLPGKAPDLVRLTELEYANFSIRFERFVADVVEETVRSQGSGSTCFISNDISEAGDFPRIKRAGLPILTLVHVDVVEFFSKMYLKKIFPPERLTAFFEWVLRSPFRRVVPKVLELVFKKQRESLAYSEAVVVPSRQMKQVLERCYPWVPADKIQVIPWGGDPEKFSTSDLDAETRRLAAQYGVRVSDTVLLTLSRISPEKGIDLLLKALVLWERDGLPPPLHLFICGEAAYMHGESYKKKLIHLARKLKVIRVHFPGYVTGLAKAGLFNLADLYVFPSRHDSYGLTLVEAMQAGLPVLSSRHHSAGDLVLDGCGEIASWDRESEAPVKILGVLKRLLKDPKKLAEMGRKAKETASPWAFSAAADRILDLAKGIINPCPDTQKNTRSQG